MNKKVKDGLKIGAIVLIAGPVVIWLLCQFAFLFGWLFNSAFQYFPSRSFYKVFPEYAIEYSELDHIEVGSLNEKTSEYVMKVMKSEDAEIYLEKLSNERVRRCWVDELKGEEQENGDYLVVFYKTDGTKAEIYLSFEGNPMTEQRVNDTNFYCKPGNCGLIPQTIDWEAKYE